MKEKVTALVDVREPPELIAAVRNHPDVEDYEITKLDAGDIVIRGVGFERKTLPDYISTLLGKEERNLPDQITKMDEAFNHGYILVEDNLESVKTLGHSQINPNSVIGSLASTEARDNGVRVKFCSNMELLVDMAVRLGRKHHEDPVSKLLPKGSVSGIDEPFAKMAYGCMDNVGKETAETLYDKFPSMSLMYDMDKEDLKGGLIEIDGIGDKTAESIIHQLYANK
jgi:ERCC4-type nuclease